MPRDGATIFGDLVGKLDVLRIECVKCRRAGHRARSPILIAPVRFQQRLSCVGTWRWCLVNQILATISLSLIRESSPRSGHYQQRILGDGTVSFAGEAVAIPCVSSVKFRAHECRTHERTPTAPINW